MPDQFWYILAGIVFVVANIILWLHQRRCKSKGITPKPAFNRFKKHEKLISKESDILIIVNLGAVAVFYSFTLFAINSGSSPDIPAEYTQTDTRLSTNFSLLFMYSGLAITMASCLSTFHKNITLKKRVILIIMCGIPLMLGVLYFVFDDTHDYRFHLRLTSNSLFIILLINWPAILLAKPFSEFYPALFRKIPLPWFQFPEQEETESDQDQNGQKA